MSWNLNNHGLPFLPGCTFRDITKSNFSRPQTLGYKNGYALPRRTVGIGQDPLLSEQLAQQEISELFSEIPDNSYDQRLTEEFIPAYVALDKKVLRFYAYFVEGVQFSPDEDHRVRPVVISYYLVDDSMSIFEPKVENSGLLQGKCLKRHRLPKNERGDHYQWKDLNLGMDLEVYGVKYHITECDKFTKEFMEREGILLNNPEPMPEDPYITHRKNSQPTFTTPSDKDNLHPTTNRFLTMDHKKIPDNSYDSHDQRLTEDFIPAYVALDKKVLRFYAYFVEGVQFSPDEDYRVRPVVDNLCAETRTVTIWYYLVDNTMAIREVHQANSSRGRFPFVMRRLRVPKKMKKNSEGFPSCVLEVSEEDVEEYYSPKDFQLGQTITLRGRSFLLYDCDSFTREYYQKNHPDMEMKPTPEKSDTQSGRKKEYPPYNGFGSPEDSLQNCLSLIPKRPRKKVMKMLENAHKVLKYTARLDSQNPDDERRHFTLSYCLSDDTISISEKTIPNSGFPGGKFLKKTRVPKPSSTVDRPEFYSPADFAIGATVQVFGHRFVLTDAAEHVLTYLEANSSQIPRQTLDSFHQKFGVRKANNQPTDQTGADKSEQSL